MKTDTCEVPEYNSGLTLIDYRIIVQIVIIQYPYLEISTNITNYIFPIAYIDSTYTMGNNIIPREHSILISKVSGSIASSNRYKNINNPITCRYWYINL